MKSIYIVTSTHHMGMDGGFTTLLSAHPTKLEADNECERVTKELEVYKHEYDYNYFEVEEVPLKEVL